MARFVFPISTHTHSQTHTHTHTHTYAYIYIMIINKYIYIYIYIIHGKYSASLGFMEFIKVYKKIPSSLLMNVIL